MSTSYVYYVLFVNKKDRNKRNVIRTLLLEYVTNDARVRVYRTVDITDERLVRNDYGYLDRDNFRRRFAEP